MPPITYNSVGVGTSANATTATWQHVIGSSATALIVGVSFNGSSSVTRTVRVGNRVLTSLAVMPSYGSHWMEIFGTLSPPTGAQSVTITTSSRISMTASSVAYNSVASFGSTSTGLFPQIPYSFTQSVTPGNWLVGAMGSAFGIAMISPAVSGVDRYINRAYPSLAILDGVSAGSSVTLHLASVSNAGGSVAAVVMVPVGSSTAIAHTVNSSLALTASRSAEASSTSVRMAVANLAVVASATASIDVQGPRSSSSSLAVTAAVSAAVSVDWQANSSLALTLNRTVSPKSTLWIFNSSLSVTTARTATASVVQAPLPPPAEKSPLRYVGRPPDTEGAVSTRSYAVAVNDRTKVTNDFIERAVDNLVYPLATTAYVDQQDATKALKSAVIAADENYIPATDHGLAVLDSTGKVEASQIPTGSITVNRVSGCFVGSVGSGTVTNTGVKSLLLGTVTITSPGYPYVVLPFAWVNGNDPAGSQISRWAGTGSAAKLVVVPTSGNAVCGWGVCSGSQKVSSYPVTPAVSEGVSGQVFTTGITLGLYGSLLAEAAGRSYTFSGGTFYVITMPAV